MDPHNKEVLKSIFSWHRIDDLSEDEIYKATKKMDVNSKPDISLDCSWGYFKKCTVLSSEKKPILFFKYVREKFFEEVLGLHLVRHFLDRKLGFYDYICGVYPKRRKEIPFLLTTYEEGKHIGNYDLKDFKYELGRQYCVHEILSLYDVEDRHFIVREDHSLCRIDFGRSFENPHREYLGFQDYLGHKKIDFLDTEFQRGYNHEKEIVRKNLGNKKRALINTIASIKSLTYDRIMVFNPDRFANRIIDHWSRIGFLKYADLEDFAWI